GMEMELARRERMARRFFRRAIEHACAQEIDDDGKRDHGEGPWRRLHLRRLGAREPFDRLPNHHAGENEQQRRLNKRGNALDLTMAVMMLSIGGPASKKHPQKSPPPRPAPP